MARQGHIPDNAWQQLVSGLGARQYQFARELPQNTLPSGVLPETGKSEMGASTQTFYSTPVPTDGTGTDSSQRLALIDQLLAVTTNPAAVAALQSARARLSPAARGK